MSATPAPDAARAELLRSALAELLRAERRLRSRDPQRPGGLSYASVRALNRLCDEGEMTAGGLARAADLTPASTTAMLDGLEAQGIVARRRSDEDRRVVLVSLTPEGEALLREKRSGWAARWEEAFADLEPRDAEAAAGVMRRIAEFFDEIGPERRA